MVIRTCMHAYMILMTHVLPTIQHICTAHIRTLINNNGPIEYMHVCMYVCTYVRSVGCIQQQVQERPVPL